MPFFVLQDVPYNQRLLSKCSISWRLQQTARPRHINTVDKKEKRGRRLIHTAAIGNLRSTVFLRRADEFYGVLHDGFLLCTEPHELCASLCAPSPSSTNLSLIVMQMKGTVLREMDARERPLHHVGT